MEFCSVAMRTVSLSKSALLTLIIVFVVSMFFSECVSAQSGGKLRRAKTAVHGKKESGDRHDEAKLPSPKERHQPKQDRPKRDRDHDSHDDHDHNRNSNRGRKRSRRHDDGFRVFFNSSPAVVYPQTSFVAAPVIVHEAPQPVYETIVVEQPVPAQVIENPIVIADSDELGTDWFDFQTSKFWAVAGSDFDGITTGGLGLLLQAPGSLGLDSSVMMLRESVDDYRDHLWLGDVNLVYEVLARGDIRGRVGLGVNWLSDSWGAESGLNLTAGVDMRLTNRLTLSAEGDFGNLGEADFLHGRVNLAHRFESCELMVGVDHYNFGGAEVNSVFTGVQLRF